MQHIEHEHEVKRKKSERVFKWAALILLVVAIIAGTFIYIMISSIPTSYRPMSLSQQQRKDAAIDFVARITEFGNKAQLDQPYEWSVDEDEINRWLASMPEIVAKYPLGNPKKIYDALESSGLQDPVISLGNGTITMMVKMRSRSKIVSLDLKTEMTPDKRLRVKLAGARVGKIPVPLSSVRDRVAKLKQKLAEYAAKPNVDQSAPAGVSTTDISTAMATLIAAIDEEPISTEFRWPVGEKKNVKIDDLSVADKKLNLHITPVNR